MVDRDAAGEAGTVTRATWPTAPGRLARTSMTVPRPSVPAAEAADRRVAVRVDAKAAVGAAPGHAATRTVADRGSPTAVSATTRTERRQREQPVADAELRDDRRRAGARRGGRAGAGAAGAGRRRRRRRRLDGAGDPRDVRPRGAARGRVGRLPKHGPGREPKGARPVDETRARDEVPLRAEAAAGAREVAAEAVPEAVRGDEVRAAGGRPTVERTRFRPARERCCSRSGSDVAPSREHDPGDVAVDEVVVHDSAARAASGDRVADDVVDEVVRDPPAARPAREHAGRR